MMKILFTENQETMRKNIKRMVQREVVPRAEEIDEKDEIPRDIPRIFSKMGLFSVLVPEEYGGLAGGLTELCIAMEEVAKGSVVCTDGNVSFVLTEPQGGSDLGGIQTKAALRGNHYFINGRKSFITNAGYAEHYITLVRTDPGSIGTKGLSFFWIGKNTEGLSFGKNEKKMGYRGVSLTELIFDDAKVPQSQFLGEEGKGMELAREFLAYSRTGIAAKAIGNAQGALENAIRYTKERPQFGKMISEFQAIRFMMAELATKVELSRSLIYRIASMVDKGVMDDVIPLVSMAKWYSTEAWRLPHKLFR